MLHATVRSQFRAHYIESLIAGKDQIGFIRGEEINYDSLIMSTICTAKNTIEPPEMKMTKHNSKNCTTDFDDVAAVPNPFFLRADTERQLQDDHSRYRIGIGRAYAAIRHKGVNCSSKIRRNHSCRIAIVRSTSDWDKNSLEPREKG